jgi:calcium-dependent protein kinase
MKSRLGTPYYVAPEVLAGDYQSHCDIWSLGVILYILVAGYPPFHGNNDAEVLQKVVAVNYDFDRPEWSNVSELVKDLIRLMLVKEPTERYTID